MVLQPLRLVHTSATDAVRQCDRRKSDSRMSCRPATRQHRVCRPYFLCCTLADSASCRTCDRKKSWLRAQLQETCRTTDFLSDVRLSYDRICLSYDITTVVSSYDRHSCRMSHCRATENRSCRRSMNQPFTRRAARRCRLRPVSSRLWQICTD